MAKKTTDEKATSKRNNSFDIIEALYDENNYLIRSNSAIDTSFYKIIPDLSKTKYKHVKNAVSLIIETNNSNKEEIRYYIDKSKKIVDVMISKANDKLKSVDSMLIGLVISKTKLVLPLNYKNIIVSDGHSGYKRILIIKRVNTVRHTNTIEIQVKYTK